MTILIIAALVVAYLVIGSVGIGLVEGLVWDKDGSFLVKDNPTRTLCVAFWPVCLVVLLCGFLLFSIVDGVPILYKRYLRGRGLKIVNPIFLPGEAARRLACVAKARLDKTETREALK